MRRLQWYKRGAAYTYPENVDDLVRITNDYIENIELNNEFNDD